MNDFEFPITRYAQSGDVNIAYQTMGEGPIELIIVPGIISHVEFAHNSPVTRAGCAGSPNSRASSRSTSGGRACRIASPAPSRSKSAWTI